MYSYTYLHNECQTHKRDGNSELKTHESEQLGISLWFYHLNFDSLILILKLRFNCTLVLLLFKECHI